MKLPKEVNIQEVAMLVGGRVEGDPAASAQAVSFNPLEASEGELVFLFDPKLLEHQDKCKASIKVVPSGSKCSGSCVLVDRPLLALQKVLNFFPARRYFPEPGIHPTAIVGEACQLGKDVAIGPYVVIGPNCKIGDNVRIMAGCIIGGEVEIGDNSLLYPGCLIADHIKMGKRVILQQGAMIGSDGFAYVTERESNLERRMRRETTLAKESNPHLKIPQIGTVVLGDDVEVGSGATIDRATMGATTIGRGTKIDNLAMIAHNCKIGEEALIIAQVAVAGSCRIGNRAILAGQCAVSDHLTVGDDAIVSGASGAMKDVPEGEVVTGVPAFPMKEFMSQIAHTRRLPRLNDEIKKLRKELEELKAAIKEGQLALTGKEA